MNAFDFNNLGNIFDISKKKNFSPLLLKKKIIKKRLFFIKKNILPGDIVIIFHNNNVEFFVDILSLWSIGACVACIDEKTGPNEFLRYQKKIKAKFLIFKNYKPKFIKNIPCIETSKIYQIKNLKKKIIQNYKFDDNALILFTSGSTGMPKGVVHTFRSLQAKWLSLQNFVPLSELSKTLCILPTTFGHGLICNALYPLLNKSTIYIISKSSVSDYLNLGKIIDKYKITFLSSVASMWKLVTSSSAGPKKKNLKRIHIGSAPLNKVMWQKVKLWSGINKVFNIYGITETGSWIAGPDINTKYYKKFIDGLVGIPWGAEIIISKSTDNNSFKNKICKVYEKGYVWIKTHCLMSGYFNAEEETRSVIQQNWFYTADVGYFDKHKNLILVGRERNEVNKGGIKISLEEIDSLYEKNKNIKEACSFVIKDKFYGENIALALVLKNKQNLKEIISWSKKNVTTYKIPINFYILDLIPKNSRGKIQRDQVISICSKIAPLN